MLLLLARDRAASAAVVFRGAGGCADQYEDCRNGWETGQRSHAVAAAQQGSGVVSSRGMGSLGVKPQLQRKL